MRSIFNANDYKLLLKNQVQLHRHEKGYKGRLSDAAGFNRSFLSHVLGSHVHITLDHAVRLARFWGLKSEETEYFLNLVSLERASTRELREYFQKKLEEIRGRSDDLARALPETKELSGEQEIVYYSSWHWSAIHILAGVPGFHSAAAIAKRLGLPIKFVSRSLSTLEEMGLVRNEGGEWKSTNVPVHAKKNALYTWLHQKAWRDRAMSDLGSGHELSFHYTGVHSLSKEDFIKLRAGVIVFLEQFHLTVSASKEDTASCLNIDLFELQPVVDE